MEGNCNGTFQGTIGAFLVSTEENVAALDGRAEYGGGRSVGGAVLDNATASV